MTQEEITKLFVDEFNSINDPDFIGGMLFKTIENDKEIYGTIYVEMFGEKMDSCCDNCLEHSPVFFPFSAEGLFPTHVSSCIGPTKYAKIVKGEIPIMKNKELTILANTIKD